MHSITLYKLRITSQHEGSTRDPNEMKSVYDDPQYATVVGEMRDKLGELREQYAAPAEDPVPHRPFEALPGMRRPAAERAPVHNH